MPYMLEDLVVNRVDLVDEGANSAAFIELYKRKEQSNMDVKEILSKMKPEHAAVINDAIEAAAEELRKSNENLATVTAERDGATEQLTTANEDLAKAKSELETLKAKVPCECDGEAGEDGVCKVCGRAKKVAFDETETLKSMPKDVRAMFEKMKAQKDAAEEEVRKAKEAEAIAKANELKAIPVDHEKLVGIVKRADAEMLELLTTINAAIEGTVLDEVGKKHTGTSTADAWSKIEAKADEVAKRDNITKAKAISVVIRENPELYKEYLKGGAN